MRKKGTITRPKKLYHVWGRIVGSNHTFNEFVYAYSEAQAKLCVHRRLEKRHPTMADIQLEYRGVKIIPPRQRLSGMLPEVDARYPCNEGCGGEPEFIPEKPELKRQKPKMLRRSVRSANLSLF